MADRNDPAIALLDEFNNRDINPGHVIRGTFTKTPRINPTPAPAVPDEPELPDVVAEVAQVDQPVAVDKPDDMDEPQVVALGDDSDYAPQGSVDSELHGISNGSETYDYFLFRAEQAVIDALLTQKGEATGQSTSYFVDGDIVDIDIAAYNASGENRVFELSRYVTLPSATFTPDNVPLRNENGTQQIINSDPLLDAGNVLRVQYYNDGGFYGEHWRIIGANIRSDGATQEDVDAYEAELVTYNNYLAELAVFNTYVEQIEAYRLYLNYQSYLSALDEYNAQVAARDTAIVELNEFNNDGQIRLVSELPFDVSHVPALQEYAMYYAYSIDDDVTANSGRAQRHWLAFFQIINKSEDSALSITQAREMTE